MQSESPFGTITQTNQAEKVTSKCIDINGY